MKRFIAAALILVMSVPAFALSDAEYLRMKKDPDFAEADERLNELYERAEASMNPENFAKLRREQRKWLAHGRDELAKKLIRENYSRLLAYTEVTKIRAQEIYNELTLDSLHTDGINGYYDSEGDEGTVYLYVAWKDRKAKLLEVRLSCNGEDWNGEGHLSGHDLTAFYGTTRAHLTFVDHDTVRIETNGAFHRAVGFDAELEYSRHYGK